MLQEIITNTNPVQVYSFDAVFNAIQPYLKEGFRFDMVTNQGYPQQIGTVYSFCIQEYRTEDVPIEPEVSVEVITETTPEVKQEPKTRRAKNQG